MDYNNSDYTWMEAPNPPPENRKPEWRCPVGLLLVLLCITVVATLMLTFTLTASWVRAQDSIIIEQQQQAIEKLQESLQDIEDVGSTGEFGKLEMLAKILDYFSYYSNDFDKEEMLNAVLRAYTQATGDLYADYLTEEEYAAQMSDNLGENVGIGVSFAQESVVISGQEWLTYNIISIFKDAPAASSNLRVGDRIYAIQVDGVFKSIAELGGYNQALATIRGEAGTTATLLALREADNGEYEIIESSIVRAAYTAESVNYRVSETDSKVGIVHLSEFDLQTPKLFKEAVLALQAKGVEYFIFDMRYNLGGDIQSVRAVLSYLLDEGDLILSAVNNTGDDAGTIYAGAVDHTGNYAESCTVAPNEVGMFANLKMVVLCNESTASSAEIFTAGLRDNKNVTIIGQKTYGKGILQRYVSLSDMTAGVYDGYVKMTMFAYVTACGVSFHGIGISPTEGYEVALSDEAKEYNFYLIPENLDNQLQKAIEAVKSK